MTGSTDGKNRSLHVVALPAFNLLVVCQKQFVESEHRRSAAQRKSDCVSNRRSYDGERDFRIDGRLQLERLGNHSERNHYADKFANRTRLVGSRRTGNGVFTLGLNEKIVNVSVQSGYRNKSEHKKTENDPRYDPASILFLIFTI